MMLLNHVGSRQAALWRSTGLLLGPLLFLLYTAELFDIISSAGLVVH